jgi:hypothetical protein
VFPARSFKRPKDRAILIGGIILAVGFLILALGYRSDRRQIMKRYAELQFGLSSWWDDKADTWDTNKLFAVIMPTCLRGGFANYLDAVAGRSKADTNAPEGTVIIFGSSALFWPSGPDHRGFPIGDRLELRKINGVWYFVDEHLD